MRKLGKYTSEVIPVGKCIDCCDFLKCLSLFMPHLYFSSFIRGLCTKQEVWRCHLGLYKCVIFFITKPSPIWEGLNRQYWIFWKIILLNDWSFTSWSLVYLLTRWCHARFASQQLSTHLSCFKILHIRQQYNIMENCSCSVCSLMLRLSLIKKKKRGGGAL